MYNTLCLALTSSSVCIFNQDELLLQGFRPIDSPFSSLSSTYSPSSIGPPTPVTIVPPLVTRGSLMLLRVGFGYQTGDPHHVSSGTAFPNISLLLKGAVVPRDHLSTHVVFLYLSQR